MKKIIIIAVAIIIVLIGYLIIKNTMVKELTTKQKVEKLLSTMSLEEKIGQMLIVFYSSPSYDTSLASSIKDNQPGGFILFKENMQSFEQISNLIKGMQSDSKIPMFISVDQEGGVVQRLKDISDSNITIIPTMEKVGIKNDENLAFQVGTVIGEELNDFGINMNYAPVIDIYSNPSNTVIGSRSFGNNELLVSNMGIAVAKGLEAVSVIPVYKHFPGHGDTTEDSHYELPILNKSKEELYSLELKPFIEAINNDAQVIMIGHIALPKITGDNTPSSLSSKIINDLLVKELNFKGLIITDALNMKALTDNYSSEEIIIKAINAGVNTLLMPGPSKSTVKTIKKAISEGKINEKQINNSVIKILTLKYNAGLLDNRKTEALKVFNNAGHQEIIDKIAE